LGADLAKSGSFARRTASQTPSRPVSIGVAGKRLPSSSDSNVTGNTTGVTVWPGIGFGQGERRARGWGHFMAPAAQVLIYASLGTQPYHTPRARRCDSHHFSQKRQRDPLRVMECTSIESHPRSEECEWDVCAKMLHNKWNKIG
jgi:hypothetical protein